MENETEKLINELPFTMEIEDKYVCYCGAEHKKRFRYELELKILQYYDYDGEPAHRYLIYYKCPDFSIGDSKRYIGQAAGMGERTIKEAIQELKRYINE